MHHKILVVGDNLEEQLAPFQEYDVNGKINGVYESWHRNGQLHTKITYMRNKTFFNLTIYSCFSIYNIQLEYYECFSSYLEQSLGKLLTICL